MSTIILVNLALDISSLVEIGPRLDLISFLFYQLQPVPPSPGTARKISFNGLKETIVLPQQAGK